MSPASEPRTLDLATLPWKLSGVTPEYWRLSMPGLWDGAGAFEVPPVDAAVPGSVQAALLEAGLLPDWNLGLNARACEWVENRHWFYETRFALPRPAAEGERLVLCCDGLDQRGWVLVNGKACGAFDNAFIPHAFDVTDALTDGENRLAIVFDLPVRWQGQFGYTSRMREWKPRYNYTWDWVSRLVQVGIWDNVRIEYRTTPRVDWLNVSTDLDPKTLRGSLCVGARFEGSPEGLEAEVALSQADGTQVGAWHGTAAALAAGLELAALKVEPWWPNGLGEQPLYTLRVRVTGGDSVVYDDERRVGFRRVAWAPCDGAPEGADPWICVVNGRPVFLQGANWVPLLPNFADVTDAALRRHVGIYRDMGANVLRTWGGAALERTPFFDACDAMGILVWQEFPLSSSGVENTPPSDEASIAAMRVIAQSYVERRKHHACILMWCGGNELTAVNADSVDAPCDEDQPMIAAMAEVARRIDPARRFVATSPSGPTFGVTPDTVGQGILWDTHGPWRCDEPGDHPEGWLDLWTKDDSLFRSECGAPGASSAELIERYRGDLPTLPADATNPLWNRTSWWIEAHRYEEEHGAPPPSLEAYVAWSQARQAALLGDAVRITKAKFPRCGGFILWMGHDCFPCTANTAVIDFEGNPKPAWHALREVFLADPEDLRQA